jgi:hypothetical protein
MRNPKKLHCHYSALPTSHCLKGCEENIQPKDADITFAKRGSNNSFQRTRKVLPPELIRYAKPVSCSAIPKAVRSAMFQGTA